MTLSIQLRVYDSRDTNLLITLEIPIWNMANVFHLLVADGSKVRYSDTVRVYDTECPSTETVLCMRFPRARVESRTDTPPVCMSVHRGDDVVSMAAHCRLISAVRPHAPCARYTPPISPVGGTRGARDSAMASVVWFFKASRPWPARQATMLAGS